MRKLSVRELNELEKGLLILKAIKKLSKEDKNYKSVIKSYCHYKFGFDPESTNRILDNLEYRLWKVILKNGKKIYEKSLDENWIKDYRLEKHFN